ncbi:hypothetical protein APY04_0306 [Hyphomicrobium sulfonivorans]|uniref:Uncharacterized protein n=1 Tax=Hyphomicrobium sulfonivorans TaxID=121290 RepID=A0A109BND6_HYPSL|nr:hypothetical protein [Hyphomicrobium sulfonivorans]KWT72023.1 hypothetical protein APY04_0306 [Hyphomicrobium sulfonivorans]
MADITQSIVPERSTSANLIVMLLVSVVVGAIVGAILGAASAAPTWLALIAGLCGTLAALFARNTIVNRIAGVGLNEFNIPSVVIVYALIASVAGSLAAKEVLDTAATYVSSGVLGAIAALFSAILMAMLMLTYYLNPHCERLDR